MVECEDESLYGAEYLRWKKQTLSGQVSDQRIICDYSKTKENDSDDEDNEDEEMEEEEEYRLELAHGYVKKGELPKGRCLGMIVDSGYMFLLDKDMSSFPRVTWHCPKYKDDGCPASFQTRITNPETVRTNLSHPSDLEVARSLLASHRMDNLESIENHRNHRPGHYKDNISPLIYGLFSREFREAVIQFLRNLMTSCSSSTGPSSPRPHPECGVWSSGTSVM